MESSAKKIIYFNDVAIGETDFECTKSLKRDEFQQEYRLYNPKSGIKTRFFCHTLTIYSDSGIIITIGNQTDQDDEFEDIPDICPSYNLTA